MKIASYSTFRKDLKTTGDLNSALRHSVSLGFDAIETLYVKEPMPTLTEVKAARRLFNDYGMPVVCYSVFADLSTDDATPIELLKRHAEYAAVLGSPYLHHTLFPILSKKINAPDYHDIFPRVLEAAAQVAHHAAALGITCLYEPQGIYFNGIEGLGIFFAQLSQSCPNVGICADAGNPLFLGADSIALTQYFAPHVRHIHVKNYTIQDTEPSVSERYLLDNGKWLGATPLQSGAVDIRAFLKALPDYGGYISIEKTGTDDEIKAAIAYLKNY